MPPIPKSWPSDAKHLLETKRSNRWIMIEWRSFKCQITPEKFHSWREPRAPVRTRSPSRGWRGLSCLPQVRAYPTGSTASTRESHTDKVAIASGARPRQGWRGHGDGQLKQGGGAGTLRCRAVRRALPVGLSRRAEVLEHDPEQGRRGPRPSAAASPVCSNPAGGATDTSHLQRQQAAVSGALGGTAGNCRRQRRACSSCKPPRPFPFPASPDSSLHLILHSTSHIRHGCFVLLPWVDNTSELSEGDPPLHSKGGDHSTKGSCCWWRRRRLLGCSCGKRLHGHRCTQWRRKHSFTWPHVGGNPS